MDWDKQNTTLLIEYFKEKRELWDSTSVDFKDRMKKHEAWKDLADKLNTDKGVVEKKMRSLIGQFQRELKRLKSGTGGILTSKWFGFQLLLFLKDKHEVRYTNTNEAGISEEDPLDAASNTQDFISPKIKKKKTFHALEAQKERYSVMKELHSERNSRDEFTVFGEHIACRLRNLREPFIVSTLQNQIHNLIFQAEMDKYSRDGARTSFNKGFFASQTNNFGPIESPRYGDTDISQFSEDSTFKRELDL